MTTFSVRIVLAASLMTGVLFSQTTSGSQPVSISESPQASAAIVTTLINAIRESARNFLLRGANYDKVDESVYIVNGKVQSRQSRERGLREFHAVDYELDEFEGIFISPSTVVLSYRVQSRMQKGDHKSKVFSVFVKHTFEWRDPQWEATKVETTAAR